MENNARTFSRIQLPVPHLKYTSQSPHSLVDSVLLIHSFAPGLWQTFLTHQSAHLLQQEAEKVTLPHTAMLQPGNSACKPRHTIQRHVTKGGTSLAWIITRDPRAAGLGRNTQGKPKYADRCCPRTL
jgi:hypothetical protein